MNWLTKTVNGFLGQLGLHLSRTSSFEGLRSELARTETQLINANTELKSLREAAEREQLLDLSKLRWRGDEPAAGLTWGVHMVGDEFVRFLLNHVTLRESSIIVEIGPGYGRILTALLQQGVPFRRYIGIEISAARVARLSQQFQDPRIEFREADILAEFDLNAVADLTFSSAVFEHLYPDFGSALDRISQYTRPGGAAVIDFIRSDENLEISAAFFEQETYMRVYSRREMNVLFEKSGLPLKEVGKISFGRDVLGREITRTIVYAAKGTSSGPSIESIETTPAQETVAVSSYETFVHRTPEPYDEHSLDPPLQPAFRNRFGGLWTDLNNADVILAGKVAIGELLPEEARLVDAWRRDGYVILPGAVSPAAIDAALIDFERAYDGKLERKIWYWDADGLHIVDANREHLRKTDSKLLELHDVSTPVQEIVFAEPISRFLRIIFERPALAFQSLGFYYGSQQHLHQDSAFVRVNSPLELVASWIALEDIHPGSGELEYFPGSHAIPHILFGGSHLWVEADNPEVLQFADALQAAAQNAGLSRRRFTAKKGDVLIWSAGLIHGGSPVTDPNLTRKSLVTHYCPADRQPMSAYKGRQPKRRSVSGHYVTAFQY